MLKKQYLGYYLDGREARAFRELRDDVDHKALAQEVAEGTIMPRDAALRAATALATAHQTGRSKTSWINGVKVDLGDEGDPDDAYRHYLQGRIDEAAASIESSILSELDYISGEEA